MLMKALQIIHPRSIELRDVPVPQLPPEGNGCIIVRTDSGLLCGSDIPFFTGNKRSSSYPLASGAPIHECVGEVIQSASRDFHPGDKVLAIPECNQGMAEYFLAQTSRAVHLNPDWEDHGAACIIQPLSTVMNAVDRMGDLRGKSVAVIGLGSIGLLFCWLLKRSGAKSLVGIDPIPGRCRKAEALGATQTICSRSIEAVHEMHVHPDKWNSPDICVEAVGHQTETINDCLELVRKYGTVVAFGVPDQPVYAFNYESFFRKNAVLIGTVTPDWADYLPKARDLFMENHDELSKLITHRLPIREAEKAFIMYERHEDGIIKAVLDIRQW
ncbi:MAG: zinc-binding dehydrogenase [Acidobacteria bacterium]|nr:zinc-binding dehydrogenase [Acidobacteriota bacterium]